ncbi:MAG: DMT family transporter [Defluviicoccus sp.]|nr:DMT family transporter [Defluviicoccus sp.]MDE0279424.1 DMT family transporter [Defluviicoccus sp.]
MAPAKYSGLIAGTLWMIGASAFFALTYVTVRELAQSMSVFTLVFIRCVFGILVLVPWLLRNGGGALKTRRWKIYAIRAVTTYTGMVTFFYGLRTVELADANAIQFTGPFFTVILLQIFVGERVGLDRWIAICFGFAGALLIVRPGFEVVVPAMLGIVYTAFAYGASNAATRALSTTEDKNAVVFYMFAMMLPLSIGPAVLDWTTPGLSDLPLLGFFLLIGYLSIHCVTRAYVHAPAAALTPAYYAQLPMVSAMAYAFYGEVPDTLTWIGAAVICVSGYWIARGARAER